MKIDLKQKSFWSGLSLVVYGIVQIFAKNETEGVQNILTGLSIIFLRDAIRKIENQANATTNK